MLVHRLRRWPNIKPTLGQCIVFAEIKQSHVYKLQYRDNLITLITQAIQKRFIREPPFNFQGGGAGADLAFSEGGGEFDKKNILL